MPLSSTWHSDAFGQKFDNTPQKVNGFENLSCLEVDSSSAENWDEDEAEVATAGTPPMLAGLEGGMVSGWLAEWVIVYLLTGDLLSEQVVMFDLLLTDE